MFGCSSSVRWGIGFGLLWEPFDPGDLCAQHLGQYWLLGPCVYDVQQMSPLQARQPWAAQLCALGENSGDSAESGRGTAHGEGHTHRTLARAGPRCIFLTNQRDSSPLLLFQGLKFEVVPSQFKETLRKASFPTPYAYAVETAKQKALEVARRMHQARKGLLLLLPWALSLGGVCRFLIDTL